MMNNAQTPNPLKSATTVRSAFGTSLQREGVRMCKPFALAHGSAQQE
jgi:hypothetical protein